MPMEKGSSLLEFLRKARWPVAAASKLSFTSPYNLNKSTCTTFPNASVAFRLHQNGHLDSRRWGPKFGGQSISPLSSRLTRHPLCAIGLSACIACVEAFWKTASFNFPRHKAFPLRA